jgi:hypothetical protein
MAASQRLDVFVVAVMYSLLLSGRFCRVPQHIRPHGVVLNRIVFRPNR